MIFGARSLSMFRAVYPTRASLARKILKGMQTLHPAVEKHAAAAADSPGARGRLACWCDYGSRDHDLPAFHLFDIRDELHFSSDGQRIETQIDTFNARHSPTYFGVRKGVSCLPRADQRPHHWHVRAREPLRVQHLRHSEQRINHNEIKYLYATDVVS